MKHPRTSNRNVYKHDSFRLRDFTLNSSGDLFSFPRSRVPPPNVHENISLTLLPWSPAMAIPPSPAARRDTATDSDASARRRSITPPSATPTLRASSRLRGNGGATRGVALSATRYVTPCVVDGSAVQQRSGVSLSRAGTRRWVCDLGHSRSNPIRKLQTRNAHLGTTGESRVPNRRGPTHDMAKVNFFLKRKGWEREREREGGKKEKSATEGYTSDISLSLPLSLSLSLSSAVISPIRDKRMFVVIKSIVFPGKLISGLEKEKPSAASSEIVVNPIDVVDAVRINANRGRKEGKYLDEQITTKTYSLLCSYLYFSCFAESHRIARRRKGHFAIFESCEFSSQRSCRKWLFNFSTSPTSLNRVSLARNPRCFRRKKNKVNGDMSWNNITAG